MTPIRSLPVAIAIGIYLLYTPSIVAQPRPVFEQLVGNEDLTASEITGLLQDPAGFIWIATRNGLNRFDGRDVRQYLHDPNDSTSISNNDILRNALYMHGGYLWVGTADGLSRYDATTDQFKQYNFSFQDTLQTEPITVRSFAATDSSTLWLGTSAGLYLLDLASDAFSVFNPVPLDSSSVSQKANIILSITRDSSGILWLGTEKSVFTFSTQSLTFSSLPFSNSVLNSPDGEIVHSLALDNNVLWIGTALGLAKKNLVTQDELLLFSSPEGSPLALDRIYDILIDDTGQRWFTSNTNGLCMVEQDLVSSSCFRHSVQDPASIADDITLSVMQDYEGQIWVGTWNGVSRMIRNAGFSTLSHDPENPNFSLSNPRVRAIYEMPDGTLLIGTDGGLNVLDPSSGRIQVHQHSSENGSISDDSVWGIASASDEVWLTTSEGLNVWNLQTGRFTSVRPEDQKGLISKYMYSVLFDDSETLWTSSQRGGIGKLENRFTGQFKSYRSANHPDSISSNIAWPLFQHKPGELLIGTLGGGLNRLEIDKEKFTAYQPDSDDPFSISGEHVLTIAGDSLGQIWLGMQNTGLNRFDPEEEKFYNFTSRDGLANNEILCILPEKDQRLWIATRNGLSIFDLKTETFIANLYKQNGLPTSMFIANACDIGSDGLFRFGTEEGMVSFYPDRLDLNIPAPRLTVSSFEVNNEPYPFDPSQTERSFSHENNTLGIRLAALSFIAPERNTFSFRLLGQDTTWIENGTNNFIYYADLPANDYTLEVRTKNSAGLSSATPLTVNFTIDPPYWETWWFRLGIMGMLGIIGAIIYRARVGYLVGLAQKDFDNRMRLKQMKLDSEIRMAELIKDVAADYHDTIGSNLGSLGLEIDLIIAKNEMSRELNKKLEYLRTRVDKISDNRLDMTWALNDSNQQFAQLLERIHDIAHEIVTEDIQLTINMEENLPELQFGMRASNNLLNLVREALYNAVRHSEAKNIYLDVMGVDLDDKNPACSIQIRDDGIGFDPQKADRNHGLDNLEMRAENMNWDLSIKSTAGGGTSIKIVLDLNMDDSSYGNGAISALD